MPKGGATSPVRRCNSCNGGGARDGSAPLFFAQIEAAETVIFLKEARPDFLQGINVPRDEPSEEGYSGFMRYACKMATGSGKTTVMGMLAAWSILNKVQNRNDARFSDVVLVVCPNVTIRSRLRELDPETGEASIYRGRDLVPPELIKDLAQGRVLTMNWHVFEPQVVHSGGERSRVMKAGREERTRETIRITARSQERRVQPRHQSAARHPARRVRQQGRSCADRRTTPGHREDSRRADWERFARWTGCWGGAEVISVSQS